MGAIKILSDSDLALLRALKMLKSLGYELNGLNDAIEARREVLHHARLRLQWAMREIDAALGAQDGQS